MSPTGKSTMLLEEDFKNKTECELSFLNYYSLQSSIPTSWKNLLITKVPKTDLLKERFDNDPYIKVGCKLKHILKTTSKELYQLIIEPKIEVPTSTRTWINMYPFLETTDWATFFRLPFNITIEPYLHIFQYKILNRLLNTREKLSCWGLVESDKCLYCNKTDTLEHHLYNYPSSKCLWNYTEQILLDHLELWYHFTECEVIFGIPILEKKTLTCLSAIFLYLWPNIILIKLKMRINRYITLN